MLVEGISDQIAVETLARRLGRELDREGVVVVPVGGAQAFRRMCAGLGPRGADLGLTGLCDAGEEQVMCGALSSTGVGVARTRAEAEALGFFVCERDLEDELVRAAGRGVVEGVLAAEGDLGSFRTLQRQPDWRGAPFDAQTHRWLRAGARRSVRYAALLVTAIELDRMPRPLIGVVTAAGR